MLGHLAIGLFLKAGRHMHQLHSHVQCLCFGHSVVFGFPAAHLAESQSNWPQGFGWPTSLPRSDFTVSDCEHFMGVTHKKPPCLMLCLWEVRPKSKRDVKELRKPLEEQPQGRSRKTLAWGKRWHTLRAF